MIEGLGFRVFYCPAYPVSEIKFDPTPRPERESWRKALAENIRKNGLVNPVIILNHPRTKCPDQWLMVGTNRLWAIRSLWWTFVPAVVTGCPGDVPAYEIETWDELQSKFRDGELYKSAYGIALKNTTPPESETYPCP